MKSIEYLNQKFVSLSTEEIIAWAFAQNKSTITTTTFGDKSAALLHLVTQVDPKAIILWVDTGYNTPATYRFAERLITHLNLNIQIYTPTVTSLRRNVLMGGIPNIEEPLHEEFTRQVKLEPFARATSQLKPHIWITGIRGQQSSFRKSLNVLSQSKNNYLKLAPLLDWSEAQQASYIDAHNLPNEPDYFDPTKVLPNRECGLHNHF